MENSIVKLSEQQENFFAGRRLHQKIEIKPLVYRIVHSSQVFELGDETKVATFMGMIVDMKVIQQFRSGPEDNYKSLCMSVDLLKPHTNSIEIQAKTCKACKKNDWNSKGKKENGQGKGKHCNESKIITIIGMSENKEIQSVPIKVFVSATDISKFDKQLTSILNKGKMPLEITVLEFSLEKSSWGDNLSSVKITRKGIVQGEQKISKIVDIVEFLDKAKDHDFDSNNDENEIYQNNEAKNVTREKNVINQEKVNKDDPIDVSNFTEDDTNDNGLVDYDEEDDGFEAFM